MENALSVFGASVRMSVGWLVNETYHDYHYFVMLNVMRVMLHTSRHILSSV